MSIQDKRVELAVLIDNIKEHSDQLSSFEVIPLQELNVILSKISQLHEKVAVLKHLSKDIQEQANSEVIASFKELPLEEEADLEERDNSHEIDEHLTTEPKEQITEEELVLDDADSDSVVSELEEEITSFESSETLVSEVQEVIEEEEIETEETPIEEESTPTIEEEQEEHKRESTHYPSDTILDSLLEEVKEEESTKEEVEAKESTLLDETLNEELVEKIERETELSSAPDINEALSEKDDSLSNQLQKQPISDLLTAIGLNERYLYSNELFNGDMEEFKNAITMLNEFKTGDEARAFFENGLRASYEWADDNVLAQALFNLVERRFQ